MNSLRAEFVEPGILTLARDGRFLQLAFVLDLAFDPPLHAIDSAVRGTVAAFPVLGCRYERRFWRDAWVPVDDARAVNEHVAADLERQTNALAVEPIDPFAGWPIRVHVIRSAHGSDAGTRLVVSALHLVVDGNGLLCVVAELIAQLANRAHTPTSPMNRSMAQVVRHLGVGDWLILARSVASESIRPLLLPFLGRWDGAFQRRSGQRPAQITTLSPAADVQSAFVDRCKRAGATINDGLVAVAARIAGKRSSGTWTGVAYTVNLRRFLRAPPPITANLSGVSFVPMRRSVTGDWDALLRRVVRVTGEQKRRMPGLSFVVFPALLLGWMPHALVRLCGSYVRGLFHTPMRRVQVITNVGVVDPYLEPLADSIRSAWMIAPFGSGAPAPVTMATTFRGRMTLSIVAENVAGVEDLAAEWRDELEAFAQPKAQHTPAR